MWLKPVSTTDTPVTTNVSVLYREPMWLKLRRQLMRVQSLRGFSALP